jgi:hypothetical protein
VVLCTWTAFETAYLNIEVIDNCGGFLSRSVLAHVSRENHGCAAQRFGLSLSAEQTKSGLLTGSLSQ